MTKHGTSIEWTHIPGAKGETWNPIRARNKESGGVGHFCTHVDEGCRHCYAERLQVRFKNPVRFAAQDAARVEIFLDEKTLSKPLHWREPRTIFVCSMTDLFGDWVSDDWLDKICAIMALCPQHTFIVLTKRPDRMRAFLRSLEHGDGLPVERLWRTCRKFSTRDPLECWPLPNVWLGTSVSEQDSADKRVPDLLATPAALRFVSYEPVLGPVDFRRWMNDWGCERCGYGGCQTDDHCNDCGWTGDIKSEFAACPECGEELTDYYACPECHATNENGFGTTLSGHTLGCIDWIIAGGESGRCARPAHPDWFKSTRDKCAAAGVPFFFKQWGEFTPGVNVDRQSGTVVTASWFNNGWWFSRENLANYESHIDDEPDLYRVGKKAAGAMLDGREHREFPNA